MTSDDDDHSARLAEHRDFLLASLEDLDLEHAAGDVDDDDYRVLSNDYTTRAADSIRRLEGNPGRTETPPRSGRRAAAWVLGACVVAALAGLLLAQFSGSRRAGDSITGDIRETSRELLFEAQQAFASGDTSSALEIYDEVLADQPANVEALTYRSWLVSRTGDPAAAVAGLDEAIAIDPEYPDARVFRAVVALDLGDTDTAVRQLSAFDSLDPGPFAQSLVADARIRERISLDRVRETLSIDDPPPFSESGLTVADVAAAAEQLAGEGELLEAVQLFDHVLADDPDNVEALTYRGWLVARAGDEQLLDSGISMLDAALEIDPRYAPALVFRAFSRNEAGDPLGAAADLATFDELEERPDDLVRLVRDFGLRESIAGG